MLAYEFASIAKGNIHEQQSHMKQSEWDELRGYVRIAGARSAEQSGELITKARDIDERRLASGEPLSACMLRRQCNGL